MKLNLPYPISANRYWRTFRTKTGVPVTVVSKEAQVYKNEVVTRAKVAGLVTPIPGYLEVSIVLHPIKPKTIRVSNDEVRCIDLDNALKVTLDSLQGIAYENDSAVRRIYAERGEPIDGGGLYVEIKRYEIRKAA